MLVLTFDRVQEELLPVRKQDNNDVSHNVTEKSIRAWILEMRGKCPDCGAECVQEINQGMDPRNERKVMKTSKAYF